MMLFCPNFGDTKIERKTGVSNVLKNLGNPFIIRLKDYMLAYLTVTQSILAKPVERI